MAHRTTDIIIMLMINKQEFHIVLLLLLLSLMWCWRCHTRHRRRCRHRNVVECNWVVGWVTWDWWWISHVYRRVYVRYRVSNPSVRSRASPFTYKRKHILLHCYFIDFCVIFMLIGMWNIAHTLVTFSSFSYCFATCSLNNTTGIYIACSLPLNVPIYEYWNESLTLYEAYR